VRWFHRRERKCGSHGYALPGPLATADAYPEWDDWDPVVTIVNGAGIPFPICVYVRANDTKALTQTAIIHATYATLLAGRQPATS